MKIYIINSAFTFGKHKGKTILQVAHEDISYINWCLINLNHFVMDEKTIEEIQNSLPEFTISAFAEQVRLQKMKSLEEEIQESYIDYGEDDDYGSSGEKYGWYNGWSDDAIDDVFEGDPMNTWNVD